MALSDLWIICGLHVALSRQESSQTLILAILHQTTVSPTFLHFKKAVYSVSPPKPTALVCYAFPFYYTSSSAMHMCISLSYLCSVLFSTPHLVRARLPGIKQSKLLSPRARPTLAGEFMAKSSPLRQKLRGAGPGPR